MYRINHLKEPNYLLVEHSTNKLRAKIHLNEGGSLQELQLKGHPVIQDLAPLSYRDTYASAILFPFANRVKDGVYNYGGKTFHLEVNQMEENNALHGLVYNKAFKVVHSEATTDYASVTLEYRHTLPSEGFPHTFSIQLNYIFKLDQMDLIVNVRNTSTEAFPFTLGWHPYFMSAHLFESSVCFDSTKKIVLGDRNITTGVSETNTEAPLEIKDRQLDDCWILNSDKVVFNTPNYKLQFNASGSNNFLQLYTPPKENAIAIEPTTGVSDSFNNKIGLRELQPSALFSIQWQLKIFENN